MSLLSSYKKKDLESFRRKSNSKSSDEMLKYLEEDQ